MYCHHASCLQDVSLHLFVRMPFLIKSTLLCPADYEKWRFSRHRSSPHAFSFCAFPFAYDAAHKVDILHYESASEQRDAFHAALMDSILSGGCPFLLLRVRPCSAVVLSKAACLPVRCAALPAAASEASRKLLQLVAQILPVKGAAPTCCCAHNRGCKGKPLPAVGRHIPQFSEGQTLHNAALHGAAPCQSRGSFEDNLSCCCR